MFHGEVAEVILLAFVWFVKRNNFILAQVFGENMKIIIETIPHEQQRYPTVGDWFYDDDGTLQIKVSKLPSEAEAALIALHELVEVILCKQAGITTKAVDDFDIIYEACREKGQADCQDEPGDHPNAPYKKQHCVATGIERIVAAELGVDWTTYEANINAL